MFQFSDIRFQSRSSSAAGDHLAYEVASASDLESLSAFSFPEGFVQEVRKRLSKKEPFVLHSYFSGGKTKEIHVFSVGKEGNFFEESGKILRELKGEVVLRAALGSDPVKRLDVLALATYRFDRYKSKKEKRSERHTLVLEGRASSELKKTLSERLRLLSCVRFARDLVNLPACDKTPEKIAKIVQGLPWERTRIEVLDRAQLEKHGFGCLLAVSSGSDAPPCVLILRRTDANPSAAKRAVVGKGVTFDAGGLQIKPEDSMYDMKSDMAGAAAVIASAYYLDAFDDLSETFLGAVALTENLLGGNAMKPLDIVRARNGKTVEIQHTDAEGRLILADLVAHLSETDSPETTLTVATLTGACIYALWYDYAGMIGNDAPFCKRIVKTAETDGFEHFWQLPLDEHMHASVEGEISDFKNVSRGMKAGASIGAAFISRFVGKSKYVHLDIAGPAYRTSAHSVFPSGGTGFGVSTLSGLFRKTR